MERVKPEYLNDLPKNRSRGIWPALAIAAFLAFFAYSAVKLHSGTQAGWEEKFGKPRAAIRAAVEGIPQQSPVQPRQQVYTPAPPEWQDKFASAQAAARYVELERQAVQQGATGQFKTGNWQNGDLRCLNGTVLKRVGDGWENLPGRC